jgi:hypothetical protein
MPQHAGFSKTAASAHISDLAGSKFISMYYWDAVSMDEKTHGQA